MPRLKLHQDIHVTGRTKMLAQDRAEERQSADVFFFAECRYFFVIYRNSRHSIDPYSLFPPDKIIIKVGNTSCQLR